MPADTAAPESVEVAARKVQAAPAAEESDSDEESVVPDIPEGDEEEGAEEDYFQRERSMPAMVWDDDLPQDHGITSTETTFSIMTAVIGAGIMALPQLPATGGMVVATAIMIFCGFATMEAGSAFFRALMANNIAVKRGNKTTGAYIHSYEDFGFAAYGRPGAILIRVVTITWFTGVCAGFVILMGQNIQNIASPIFFLNYRIWVLILSPLLWFLSMMRDVSAIAKLMPLGIGAATASCALIIVKAAVDAQKWEDWPPEDVKQLHNAWPQGNFMSLGSVTATCLGAVGCMGNVPSIIDEMKKKHRFKRCFRTALTLTLLLYSGIMLIGYYGYGNFIQPNIVDSMKYHPTSFEESKLPPSQWTGRETVQVPTVMSICVVVNLLISYPLCMAPLFIAIQGTRYGRENLKPGSKLNYIMRTCIVVITIVIPLLITNFSIVFNLFASICGPSQGVLAPIIFSWQIRKKVGAKGSGFSRTGWHFILLAVAVFCMGFGFIDSMGDLLRHLG